MGTVDRRKGMEEHECISMRRPAAALIAALSASSVLLGLVFASTRWPTRGGRVELDGPGAEVEVPTKLLVAIKRDLASDSLNMVALKRKVSRLGKAVSQLRLQRAARGDRGTRGRTVRWMKNGQQSRADARRGQAGSRQALLQQRKDSYNKEVAVDSTRRILVEKQMDFLRDFPHWAMNSALSDAAKAHGQPAEWRANRGPPYVGAITLFAGQGVDKQGSGNLVRRILGLKTSFRFHKWEGNSFLKDFDNPLPLPLQKRALAADSPADC